jgi:alanyl-tRNA synthetase
VDVTIDVYDVKKVHDKVLHYGKIERGTIDSAAVFVEINLENRERTARNHTATHLLHQALKITLGEHVQQKGSLVSPEYLRFDFAHYQALTTEQIRDIERIVNQQIRENRPVSINQMSIDQARKDGAVALFGEKYGDVVRVVNVTGFSMELCGGIHIHATGEIGLFKIISESSTAAGIRRIEAFTGDAAEDFIYQLQDNVCKVAALLNTPEKKLLEKVEQIQKHQSQLEKELQSLRQNNAKGLANELAEQAVLINGTNCIITKVAVASSDELRKLGDELKADKPNTVSVLFAVTDDKVAINVTVSVDLMSRFHAGKLAGQIAAFVGGKGGGKPDSAMAGGKDIDKIDFAIAETKRIFSS